MASKIKVEISKTCLSFLMRDNANSDGDQEGFLLGQVIQVKGRDINDQNAEQATETTVIKITSHMCMSRACMFYNPVGRIDPEKIEYVLGPFKNKVVGYFDFKREYPIETGTKPTFRTTALFSNLCKWMSANQKQIGPSTSQPANEGTLMILRQYHSSSKAIINNTYCFYRFNDKKLEKIGSYIPNLGDTSHSLYVSEPPVTGIDDIIKKNLPQMPAMAPEDMPVVRMHQALMDKIREAGHEVDEAEKQLKDRRERLQDIQERAATVKLEIAALLKQEEEKKTNLAKNVKVESKVEPFNLEDIEDNPPTASSTPNPGHTKQTTSSRTVATRLRVKQEVVVKQEEPVEEDILTATAIAKSEEGANKATGRNQPVLTNKTKGRKTTLSMKK